jgi:MFS transporter
MSSELLKQLKAVWAVAFACVVAFIGIGLVDPILPVLAQDLDASPSQVELLFTPYFAVTGVAMLVTGFASSRLGAKRTLLGAGASIGVVNTVLTEAVMKVAPPSSSSAAPPEGIARSPARSREIRGATSRSSRPARIARCWAPTSPPAGSFPPPLRAPRAPARPRSASGPPRPRGTPP